MSLSLACSGRRRNIKFLKQKPLGGLGTEAGYTAKISDAFHVRLSVQRVRLLGESSLSLTDVLQVTARSFYPIFQQKMSRQAASTWVYTFLHRFVRTGVRSTVVAPKPHCNIHLLFLQNTNLRKIRGCFCADACRKVVKSSLKVLLGSRWDVKQPHWVGSNRKSCSVPGQQSFE